MLIALLFLSIIDKLQWLPDFLKHFYRKLAETAQTALHQTAQILLIHQILYYRASKQHFLCKARRNSHRAQILPIHQILCHRASKQHFLCKARRNSHRAQILPIHQILCHRASKQHFLCKARRNSPRAQILVMRFSALIKNCQKIV